MPVSDALVVGEDWISAHYFATDATRESFQGRVIERRKTWDAEAADDHATTRSRFVAARADLEKRLVAALGSATQTEEEPEDRATAGAPPHAGAARRHR